MTKLNFMQKEYCNNHGWIRKKGILLDTSMIDDYDEFFIPDDYKEDFYQEVWKWVDANGDDPSIYDDDEIIDFIEEEIAQVSFEKWKVFKKYSELPTEKEAGFKPIEDLFHAEIPEDSTREKVNKEILKDYSQ